MHSDQLHSGSGIADAIIAKRGYFSVLGPAELASLRGRIGAFVLHATHDSRETTSAARAAFLGRFEREVDPDRVLPDAERQRRAQMARKAHFARLALASARARQRGLSGGRDAK